MALAVVANALQKYKQNISFSPYSLKVVALAVILFSPEVVASHCGENQFIVDHADGSVSCEDCESCSPGQGLSHRCGTHIPSNAMVVCMPCQPGDTFSSGDDTSNCAPCSSCAEDQVVLKKCTSTNDVKCEKKCHSKDRYFDSSSGSCLPCSTCCGDGGDKFEDECKRKFGATSDSVCSFNKSINRCDGTTTATSSTTVTNKKNSSNATSTPSLTGIPTTFTSDVRSQGSYGTHPSEGTCGSEADYVALYVVLPIVTIVALAALGVYVWYGRRKHSKLSRDNSDAENGSHHSGGDNEEEEHELVDMRKKEMVAEEGVVSARICVEVNEEEQDQKESNDPLLGKKVFVSGRRKHCNLSGDNSDAEKGSHHPGGDNEEEEHELVAMGKKEMVAEEGVVSARICVEVNEEEQDQKGSNDPLLGKQDRARFTCKCQKRAKKDSKPLVRLLEDLSLLQDICAVLDAPAPGCGNWERLAQSYGYNYYQITSVLKKFDGGPSRGLIEGVVAAYPDLTVEEFATSVEKKTNRNDVAKELRHFDSKEVGQ